MAAVTRKGATSLHYAASSKEGNCLEVARILLRKGGTSLLAVKNKKQQTAADVAASEEMGKLLEAAGTEGWDKREKEVAGGKGEEDRKEESEKTAGDGQSVEGRKSDSGDKQYGLDIGDGERREGAEKQDKGECEDDEGVKN